MSGLIAQKEYESLDTLFAKTQRQMIFVGTVCLFLFISIIYFIQETNVSFFGIEFANRFLSIVPLCLMAWASWTMFPISCWATYLRCHKKEPLLLNSVVVGILCCMSTIGLGNLYGLYGMVIGFSVLRLVSLTWIYLIYKKKKYEWHKG